MSREVRVVVRVRPENRSEGGSVQISENQDAIFCDGTRFQFDAVLGPKSSQLQTFHQCAEPLVKKVLEGESGCLFAYGQTGSGKTHSVIGSGGGTSSLSGCLPQACAELFRCISRLEEDAASLAVPMSFQVNVSFVEIYLEKAYDLLVGVGKSTVVERAPLKVREFKESGHVATEATLHSVRSVEELLSFVQEGSKTRSTARTDMNLHSSRSHAILTLEVERRWTVKKENGTGNKLMKRIARLALVDLAGSEAMSRSFASNGGKADPAGIATNLGLSTLSRVMLARANLQSESSGGDGGGGSSHAPYRDSTLTFLLRPYLSSAELVLLVCISARSDNTSETISSIKFGTVVKDTRTSFRKMEEREEDITDLAIEDPDTVLNRRTFWLEPPGFPRLHARVVGNENDPLILYIHGSGPKNSSNQWSHIATQISNMSTQPYFQVAIDCPGYGISEGRKQLVRSYPGDLISAVLRCLGRRTAACLVGSSQGAAAVLNCLYEKPMVAYGGFVLHPVTMAPEKFSKLEADVTAVYDVDDAGHPVSVGRRLRTIIPKCTYIEGSSSRDGSGFDIDLAPGLILDLLKKCRQFENSSSDSITSKKQKCFGLRDKKLPMLCRLAGGLDAWSRVNNGEWAPLTGAGRSGSTSSAYRESEQQEEEAEEEERCGVNNENVWRPQIDVNTGKIRYVNLSSGRVVSIRPVSGRVLVETLGKEANSVDTNIVEKKRRIRNMLFHHKDLKQSHISDASGGSGGGGINITDKYVLESNDCIAVEGYDGYHSSEDEEERATRKAKQAEKEELFRLQMESQQTLCMLCQQALIQPKRMEECRCILCRCCVETSVYYTARCPCCGLKESKKQMLKMSSSEDNNDKEEGKEEKECNHKAQYLSSFGAQEALLKQLQHSRKKRSKRLVIEYGNTAEVIGPSRIRFVTSVNLVKNKSFSDNAIKRVDFNINPSFSKPTTSLLKANRKGIFEFEYTMGRPFPCVVTVHFLDALAICPMQLHFEVQETESCTRRRIVISISETMGKGEENTAHKMSKKVSKKPLIVNVDPPVDVWIDYSDEGNKSEVPQVSTIGLK